MSTRRAPRGAGFWRTAQRRARSWRRRTSARRSLAMSKFIEPHSDRASSQIGAPDRTSRMRRYRSVAVSVASIAGLLALWYLGSRFGLIKPSVLPSPGDLWRTFVELLSQGYSNKPFLIHVAASMTRAL